MILLILIIWYLSTYLLIFVHLGVDAAGAAGVVRTDQPVPCRGVEEELVPVNLDSVTVTYCETSRLVPVNLLPNWAAVDEQV